MDEHPSSGETAPQANGASYEPWTYDAYDAYDAYAAQYYAETEGRLSGHATGTFAVGAHDTGTFGGAAYDTGAYGTVTHGADAFTTGTYDTGTYDTGTYDTGSWDTGDALDTGSWDTGTWNTGSWDTNTWDTGSWDSGTPGTGGRDADDGPSAASVPGQRTGAHDSSDAPAGSPLAATRAGSRRRRRAPVRRTALLRVAVPSACVMGVAAAVTVVSTDESTDDTAAAGSDPRPVKPSYEDEFAAQLGGITAAANDFGDRASREQERADLAEQREAEMKRAAREAAKKERLRPKFVSPVDRRGLSAYYGAAGARWARGHTGIDFPVSYGTPVYSVTDGVVSHKVNSALGNMVIVTAKDGTETWYCHLASWKLAPGTVVRAGDTIAYSGDSGNSSGPHLHLEVHPGGGGAVDPLAWLISHGVDPA